MVQEFPPKFRQVLRVYTKGINHFIQTASLPIEFSLLGYKPEPWQLGDTIAPFYFLSWRLNASFAKEALCALLVQQLGGKLAQDLCLIDDAFV